MIVLGSAELLVLLGILLIVGIQVAAIVDIIRHSDSDWQGIDESRFAWLLVAVLGSVIGSVIYFAHLRPKFARLAEFPNAAY